MEGSCRGCLNTHVLQFGRIEPSTRSTASQRLLSSYFYSWDQDCSIYLSVQDEVLSGQIRLWLIIGKAIEISGGTSVEFFIFAKAMTSRHHVNGLFTDTSLEQCSGVGGMRKNVMGNFLVPWSQLQYWYLGTKHNIITTIVSGTLDLRSGVWACQ